MSEFKKELNTLENNIDEILKNIKTQRKKQNIIIIVSVIITILIRFFLDFIFNLL